MHIVDMRKRFDYLVDQRAVVTDPDERSRLEIQIQHYRKEIARSELEHHIGSLEFEARYTSDLAEKDDTFDAIRHARRELEAMDDG